MAILYPHRQTLLIVLVCSAAVCGTAWYVHQQKPPTVAVQKVNILANNNVINASSTVSTGQTEDWRSQFLNTDQKDTSAAVKKVASTEALTLTDHLGRNFFTNYIYLQQGGLTTNDQAVQNAVNNALSETAIKAPLPKIYSTNSITSYTDDSPSSIHTYGNAVALAFSLYAPRTDSADIATSAFDNDDMSLLAQIDPIISGYTRTIAALVTTSVPSSLVEQHTDLLNGLSAMKYASEGLRNGDKDPMQALMGISTYGTAQTTLQGALRSLKVRLDSQNISFTADEPGIAFLSMPSSTH